MLTAHCEKWQRDERDGVRQNELHEKYRRSRYDYSLFSIGKPRVYIIKKKERKIDRY